MSDAPNNRRYDEYQNLNFHPYNILLMLILAGVSALFLAFSVAFVYTRFQNGLPAVKLPNLFYFNTIILLASSYTMIWAKKCYLADETLKYQQALVYTILLSFVFMALQVVAWYQLLEEIPLNSSNSASYLYLLSAVHFAHVIAGLPFLGLFLYTARKKMKEPVSVLVYFSDPDKKLKLRLLTVYWHFLDALWIYLVVFLLINYLVN